MREEKAWREGEKEGGKNEERKKEEQENEKKIIRTLFKSNRAKQEGFIKCIHCLHSPHLLFNTAL